MAAADLSLGVKLSGSGTLFGALAGSTRSDRVTLGRGDWDGMDLGWLFGTSDTPASGGQGYLNAWHCRDYTIAAGANQDLDLAGGVTDFEGSAITFTKIKVVLIGVQSPDGSKAVRVGPQGVANAWQGPFGGVAAANYLTVRRWLPLVLDTHAGYAVTAGTGDILRLNNPGASSIDVSVLIGGVQ